MKLIHFNIKSLKCNITKCDYSQEIQKELCYKTLVKPVALYTYSIRATTKSDERKLEVFEEDIRSKEKQRKRLWNTKQWRTEKSLWWNLCLWYLKNIKIS